ncbi:MAG: hypothetical protein GX061_03985 [Eubacteriaceae bacterium]|nr:hypothetical protein [Eubacteriaceae bacterium]
MKNRKCRILCLLLIMLLLTSCAKEEVTPPITTVTLTADKTDILLEDTTDTLVTYTVKTPADCIYISIGRLVLRGDFYSDWYYNGLDYVNAKMEEDPDYYTIAMDEVGFDKNSSEVVVTEIAGGLEWVLSLDFGHIGLYTVKLRAVMVDGREQSAAVDVNIHYNELDIFTLGTCAAWEAYILRNTTEPFVFVTDLANCGYDYMGMDLNMWGHLSILSGECSIFCLPWLESEKAAYKERTGITMPNPWEAWLKYNSPVYGETALIRPYNNNLSMVCLGSTVSPLPGYTLPTNRYMVIYSIEAEGTPAVNYEKPAAEFIFDSCRAAVCYRGGVRPNETLFPKAAFLYDRGLEVLSSILTEGMGDYEKVKAIHDWMLTDGKTHSQSGEFKSLSKAEQESALKCSYGFMKGYGGDCMGWSDTFRMLCGMAGVRCSAVSCYSGKGGAVDKIDIYDHSFNVAVLDGEVYYFDVYWDGAGAGYNNPPYTYFAMTSAEAGKNHKWLSPEAWGPPEATSTRYATDATTGQLVNKQ